MNRAALARLLLWLCQQRVQAANRMRTPGYVASPAEVEAAQAVEAEIARRWAELATCSTERTPSS